MMKQLLYLSLVLSTTFLYSTCQNPKRDTKEKIEKATRFQIERGVNISHWLSQSRARGAERETFFTQKDVEFIASIGYDHIRIPIDEEQMWNEEGIKEKEAFALLHNGIKWALERKLKVIIDLHILRTHHFNADEKPLWTDPNAQEQFFQCWRDLSSALMEYPADQLAYELMNEPVADNPDKWNELVLKASQVVRANEPERFLVIGSNRWQSVHTFNELKVPEGDKYIILSFHFYHPMLITHHQASWVSTADYDGPVKYPGLIIEKENINHIQDTTLRKKLIDDNGTFDRAVLSEMIQKPVQKAKELNLQLYCGEWGCYPTIPRESFLNWYSDVLDILNENDIAWANWDYKGGFGIADRNNENKPIDDLIEVLLK